MKRRGAPRNLAGRDSLSSSRISGRKTRKRPKYLSLRSQFSPQNKAAVADKDVPRTNGHRLRPLRHYYTRRTRCKGDQKHPKQMQPRVTCTLLPLENCQAMDDHVALLFTSSDDASATLKGLLDCREDDTCTMAPTAAGASREESVSPRCTSDGAGPKLRSALKNSYSSRDGGENHEEKWVQFSEVVKKKEEEVSSNYPTAAAAARGLLSLSLKLDHQEILDTWSDRSSLFICHGIGTDESPQTVPDLCTEFDVFGSGMMEWVSSGANIWMVPEKGEIGDGVNCGDKEGRMRRREASVLRYKKKRQNRLFAKRIRYEVRKLYAEKRPRVKGRFVRRKVED